MMGAFAAPQAAPAAPDPFGLAGRAPAPAPPPAAWSPPPPAPPPPASDPFGIGAAPAFAPPPAADPFGIAAAPAPPPTADQFGTSAAPAFAPPAADPFGVATAPPSGDALGAPPSQPTAPTADPWAALHAHDAVDFAAAVAPPVSAPSSISPEPVAPEPVAAKSAPSDAALIERFLDGAGLKRSDLGDAPPAGVLEAAGQLLRQTADGLIRLLDARARVRHQFGVGAQVTAFTRDGNNPLKWTRSPEQAVKQLVGTPERGFLPGPRAVQGAFEDLQAHEVAMLAAMQEALGATVERFSPDAIKARASKRGFLGGIMPGAREATLWRAFEAEFQSMADESQAAFLDLFAKQFAKAYARAISKADR